MHHANVTEIQELPPEMVMNARPQTMSAKRFLEILRETGAIGAWKDRTDNKNSSEYTRELCQRAEIRDHS